MAKKEYVSKYAPKWLVFPREDMTYREFATEKEAQAFKEKCKKNFLAMSQQIGNIYRVSYWRKFETPQEYDEDKEYIEKNKPKAIIRKSALEEMSMEEVNEKLQKKLTTERKRAPKKKK